MVLTREHNRCLLKTQWQQLDIAAQAYNPNSSESEAGPLQAKGQFGLHSEFQVSRGYLMRHPTPLKKETKQ